MFQSRGNRRPGFTLIELLVVIAIIGVLVSLLLPAVQKVREAANNMTCKNNLKQLGLALVNYQSQNGCFPLARSQQTGGIEHNWITRILPNIEQENLFRSYQFGTTWSANPAAVIQTKIKVLLCPSAPSKRAANQAHSDYAATNPNRPSTDLLTKYPGGPMDLYTQAQYHNSGVLNTFTTVNDLAGNKIADILDGTSNTIMVAEDAGRNYLWIQGELAATSGTGGQWADPTALIHLRGYEPSRDPARQAVAASFGGGPPLPSCPINCVNKNEIYSFHTGVANVVLADGSVHSMRATTDYLVLRALATIAGREAVSPDF